MLFSCLSRVLHIYFYIVKHMHSAVYIQTNISLFSLNRSLFVLTNWKKSRAAQSVSCQLSVILGHREAEGWSAGPNRRPARLSWRREALFVLLRKPEGPLPYLTAIAGAAQLRDAVNSSSEMLSVLTAGIEHLYFNNYYHSNHAYWAPLSKQLFGVLCLVGKCWRFWLSTLQI
jgi:hypothetical protein